MSIRDRLTADMKEAMKAKDAVRLSTIRMLISALKNKEIDSRGGGGGGLDDEAVIAVLSTAAKQRREAAEQYVKGGRQDLADKETSELAVIESYLPEQMSAEDVEAAVKKAVADTGASSPKDMGKVMKELMPVLKGKADGKLINELVKKNLSG